MGGSMTATASRTTLRIELPLRLVNGLNAREHWATRQKRAREQRSLVRYFLARHVAWPLRLPCSVAITRIGPGRMDGDGLQASAKHVRDGVADALGVDDGGELVTWRYEQEKRGRGVYGVVVEVRER